MNVWSKVLVVLILLATFPLFYLAMRVLQTNDAWRSKVNQLETATRRKIDGPPSLDELTVQIRDTSRELHNVIVDRGRVWRNVKLDKPFDPATAETSLTVDVPQPHGIVPKMVLYVFDAENYLGEFHVTEAADTNITIAPNIKPSERQLKTLAASGGDITLYEIMPVDRHDIFAGIDEATLRSMLPEEVVAEYLKDGQPAGPNDPPARVVDGKYERQLIDYGFIFHELDRHISELVDRKAAAERDLAAMEEAVADAKKQIEFMNATIAELDTEKKRSSTERDLITRERESLEKALAALREEIAATLAKNRQLAAEWTRIQLRMAEEVEKAVAASQN